MTRIAFGWWPPTQLTRPWLPRVWRGDDEYGNPAVSIVIPPLGAFHCWLLRNEAPILCHLCKKEIEGGDRLEARLREELRQAVAEKEECLRNGALVAAGYENLLEEAERLRAAIRNHRDYTHEWRDYRERDRVLWAVLPEENTRDPA